MKNAFSIIKQGDRLKLECDVTTFTLDGAGDAISVFLGMNSDFVSNPIHANDSVFGNSIAVSRLTIDGGRSFHVKLLDAPDAESVYLSSILLKYPHLAEDTGILVPIIIDVVASLNEEAAFYIHVTPWQENGTPLSVWMINQWISGKRKELEMTLYAFGQFLQGFHKSYPRLMHNDMNPSNVLLVLRESILSFVLTDCAGLDDEVGDDCKSFIDSLGVLSEGGFGDPFLHLSVRSFQDGYNSLI